MQGYSHTCRRLSVLKWHFLIQSSIANFSVRIRIRCRHVLYTRTRSTEMPFLCQQHWQRRCRRRRLRQQKSGTNETSYICRFVEFVARIYSNKYTVFGSRNHQCNAWHEIIKYELESMDAVSSNGRKSGRSMDIYMELKHTHANLYFCACIIGKKFVRKKLQALKNVWHQWSSERILQIIVVVFSVHILGNGINAKCICARCVTSNMYRYTVIK